MLEPFDEIEMDGMELDAEDVSADGLSVYEPSGGRKKLPGFFGTLMFQVILCLVIIIAMVLLNTFFPRQYNDIAGTIQQEIREDGGFAGDMKNVWERFLGLINQKGAGQKTGTDSSVPDVSGLQGPEGTASDSSAVSEEASAPSEEEAPAGGAPAENSVVPANATLEPVSYQNNLILPLKAGMNETSGYGVRTHPITGEQDFHSGMDSAADEGTPILAVQGGTVEISATSSGYGNYIKIRHGDGTCSLYAHCKELYFKKGDAVKQGETIAAVGSTGISTGPHLHFSFLINDVFVNPAYILQYAGA